MYLKHEYKNSLFPVRGIDLEPGILQQAKALRRRHPRKVDAPVASMDDVPAGIDVIGPHDDAQHLMLCIARRRLQR